MGNATQYCRLGLFQDSDFADEINFTGILMFIWKSNIRSFELDVQETIFDIS